jgi:hypothetical protein
VFRCNRARGHALPQFVTLINMAKLRTRNAKYEAMRAMSALDLRKLLEKSEKERQLRKNARWFEFRLWSEPQEVDAAVDALLSAFKEAKAASGRKRAPGIKKYGSVIKVLICNLGSVFSSSDYIKLGRRTASFPAMDQYNPGKVKRDTSKAIVDWLSSKEFVKHLKAKPRDPKHKGKKKQTKNEISKLKSTQRLWTFLGIELSTVVFRPHPDSEFIGLREKTDDEDGGGGFQRDHFRRFAGPMGATNAGLKGTILPIGQTSPCSLIQ